MDKINTIGIEAENRIDLIRDRRTDDNNAQLIFKSLKDDSTRLFRDRSKVLVPKMDKEINGMKDNLKKTLNNPMMSEDERLTESATLQEKINAAERVRFQKIRDNTAARNRLDGETLATNYWTSSAKERKPRDTMLSLQVPGSDPPVYVKRSDKMAELAKDFHENLQTEGLEPPDVQAEAEAKSHANIKCLGQQSKAKLSQYLTRGDIVQVLKKLPNGKTPGIDGLVHELWKFLHEKYEKAKNEEKKPFDIAKVMTAVYNDIEKYGVHPDTGFAEGWMCLLHKKNDKRNVSNYRPITLLNTDYKTLKKALAIKLAETVPSIIHKDQAGFIPGRSIVDQIKLVESIINHAEHESEGGAVVALDQEKAYDKIRHDYLWRTMERANFPNHFTKTIRSLYENAIYISYGKWRKK
jgi:hypothetical protein